MDDFPHLAGGTVSEDNAVALTKIVDKMEHVLSTADPTTTTTSSDPTTNSQEGNNYTYQLIDSIKRKVGYPYKSSLPPTHTLFIKKGITTNDMIY